MSEIVPDLSTGFSPRNVERIYRGEPALVGDKTPEEVLTSRQFKALTYIANGLSYRAIAEETGVNPSTFADQVLYGKQRLGVMHRNQLAGYFPLAANHELLAYKKLKYLQRATKRLGVLEALSVGHGYEQAAQDLGISYNTATAHIGNISKVWHGVQGAMLAVAVANGLRAQYVRVIEATPQGLQPDDIGKLTLPNLAKIEAGILDAHSLET